MGYPKEVYDSAWQELARRARQARERQTARREEIRRRIPEIDGYEQQLSATAREVTKAIIAGPEAAATRLAALQKMNLDMQRERGRLLVENGYPADYLDEQHGCSQCRDTGYVETRMCACLRDLLTKAAYAKLSAVSGAGTCSFDNFSLGYYPDHPPNGSDVVPRQRMGKILDFCRQYAEGFSPLADSLLFIGPTGLGKTHLSLAIASAATGAGYGVVYTPVQRLMDRLEAEKFSRSSENRDQYTDNMNYILGCDLLVLDDLGTEFYTQFTGSVLYNIINSRMVEGRPTIISTNLELAQMEERYSQRMVSRLVCGYKVLKFYGKDIRFVRKSENQ